MFSLPAPVAVEACLMITSEKVLLRVDLGEISSVSPSYVDAFVDNSTSPAVWNVHFINAKYLSVAATVTFNFDLDFGGNISREYSALLATDDYQQRDLPFPGTSGYAIFVNHVKMRIEIYDDYHTDKLHVESSINSLILGTNVVTFNSTTLTVNGEVRTVT